jgi:hypothetical protein
MEDTNFNWILNRMSVLNVFRHVLENVKEVILIFI